MPFDFLGEDQRLFLSRGYLQEGVTPAQRYREICDALERISGIEGFGDKFYEYCEKGWVSFSTPILTNFGHGVNLPISCNFSSVEEDSLHGILTGVYELGMLSKYGAGTAVDFSTIRPMGEAISAGGTSDGVMPWVKLFEETITKVSQGSSRRGAMAAYLRTDHPDIMQFLDCGTPHHPVQNVNTGVIWDKDLSAKAKAGHLPSQEIVAKIHKRRSEVGTPYIIFEKNCHLNIPDFMVTKPNKRLAMSNLCTECFSDVALDETYACNLLSGNAVHFDEWQNTDFIHDLRIAGDCVGTEYIEKAEGRKGFERAVRYYRNHRSVGIGLLGFHTYLQNNDIVVGSLKSHQVNNDMFSHMKAETDRANLWMGANWGEAPYCKGSGLRGDLSMAVAPNKSTAFIMGDVSEGIGIIKSNYTVKQRAKIQVEWKNPRLIKVLQDLGQDTREVWESIKDKNGSVQHLDFLSQHQRDLFKTMQEVSQMDIIKLAAQRQKFIDQGQSLNLMFHPNEPKRDIVNMVFEAEELGIKSIYYQYNLNASQTFLQGLNECSACSG